MKSCICFCQFGYTKGTASMPFLLYALMSFQGSAHLLGVGSSLVYDRNRWVC